ncbi:MAG: ABC transporter substrate-binding protein [Haloplanus sp.]
MSETIDVQLNWEPTGFQAPFFLARERGFYADAGLDVRLMGAWGGGVGTGSPFAAERAADRKCEFAWSGGAGLALARSRGNDVVAVAGATHRTPAAIFTLDEVFDGALERPEQLAGCTIAPTATKTSLLAQLLLRDAGIRDQVDVLGVDRHTHHRPQRKLLDGSVDAAVGVVTNGHELAQEYDRTAHELAIGPRLPVYGMSLVTHPSYAASNPETVASFLAACARGWAAAIRNPTAAIDAVVKQNASLEYARDIERRKFDRMVTSFVDAERFEACWGHHGPEQWHNLIDRMTAANMLDGVVDADDCYTNAYLDPDRPALGSFAARIADVTE